MNKKVLFSLLLGAVTSGVLAQVSFTESASDLNNSTLRSGVAVAITDMNEDGLDDLVRFNNGTLEIEYQQTDGTFTQYTGGSYGSPWGVTIADTDENGYNDLIVGGFYDDLKYITASNDGTSYSSVNLAGPSIFLQNANMADIDNDGAIDFFGCHDEGISSPYHNDGSGGLTYDLNLINAESTVPSDNSGNYGSIWTDYDNDGDLDLYISKCRQGVNDPTDGRRLNLMFQNDGNNNFTDVAAAIGLQPQLQSWSANFEDIDNDGDLDVVLVNHDANNQIFENNGDGTFSDITTASGIETELAEIGLGVQVAMEDFDNDGWIDILITTVRGTGTHHLFLNDGDGTFTVVNSPFDTGGKTMHTAALGDLNNDGFIDVIAGFANGFNNPSSDPDLLFINDGNANNWSKVRLEGDTSNKNGIGARIEIEGAWGTQIREVRAGESYGTQNSMITHFGIGTATAIDKITVRWPSGTVDEIVSPNINETIFVFEGGGLGVDENSLANGVQLFPNPAQEQISVNLRSEAETLPLTIYDLGGKQVLTQEVAGTGVTTLSLSQLNSGVYFVNVNNQVIKLIKQ